MTATPLRRIVIDTNIFVSALLSPGSSASRAVSHTLTQAAIVTSEQTLAELAEVLARAKFNERLSAIKREETLALYAATFQPTPTTHTITDCRDPRDNKFLELALSGQADLILTGDRDLLVLHPWRSIAILSPADYLQSEIEQ